MKLFVIGGKARSGKTTFGNYMKEELKTYGYKPCVMHITEPLYGYARNYFEWEESDGKPREFLQNMGIEVIKNKLHKDYFLLDRLCEDIEVLSEFFDVFIITDARLKVEFEELKKRYLDVTLIKLERNNYEDELSDKERKHVTETEIDTYDKFDYVIENNSFEELDKQVKDLINKEVNNGEDLI